MENDRKRESFCLARWGRFIWVRILQLKRGASFLWENHSSDNVEANGPFLDTVSMELMILLIRLQRLSPAEAKEREAWLTKQVLQGYSFFNLSSDSLKKDVHRRVKEWYAAKGGENPPRKTDLARFLAAMSHLIQSVCWVRFDGSSVTISGVQDFHQIFSRWVLMDVRSSTAFWTAFNEVAAIWSTLKPNLTGWQKALLPELQPIVSPDACKDDSTRVVTEAPITACHEQPA